MIKTPLTLLIILSFVCNSFSQSVKFKPVKYPSNYTATIDQVYTEINGWQGRMDLYTNSTSETPTPIVINIHGGGWESGQKESQTGFGTFFKKGYAVANVEYRLTDVAPAPAAIQDVRCALIYIYKHAKSLNVDTDKIVIMGGSAGGHLALMAGLLGNNKKFDTNCNYKGTIKVAAIIDEYGPADLTVLHHDGSAKRWLSNHYLNTEFVKSVSPMYYVSKDSPPTFIVHGDKDPTVPYSQSVKLYNKLKAQGVKTEFMTVKGGKHGNFSRSQKSDFGKFVWPFLESLGL
ncbi:alpha/beta hydrolase [Pseudotamlana agarivorans]|uniref:alpha/beta hydrolase n=1 Tax=Pseudotamlana agarivorans TaxID=481183 RepID=UPI0009FD77C7|nr:alpha/beta hydrolase [Tamlana agarivorans]